MFMWIWWDLFQFQQKVTPTFSPLWTGVQDGQKWSLCGPLLLKRVRMLSL